jgi:lipopolysaccharide export system permease protein
LAADLRHEDAIASFGCPQYIAAMQKLSDGRRVPPRNNGSRDGTGLGARLRAVLNIGAIDGYVIKITLVSFLIVLISLTGVIWITQALRNIDLMTSQGQTILVFLGISGLAIPLLISIIAPIALLVAVMHALNRLGTDSEVIVISAAGIPPLRFLRPFMLATVAVCAMIAFISLYLAPECLRALRRWNTQLGADVVANVIQPGQFIKLDKLTLRIRERLPGNVLHGLFIDDRRDPQQRVNIIADRGTVETNSRGSFLILEDGNLQRFEAGQRDPALVAFKSYAFDLSAFSNPNPSIIYNVHERLTPELLAPPPDIAASPADVREFRTEFHDRLFAPLYPVVFALLAFAFLGMPRTTRQSRNFAISAMLLTVLVVRIAGFACTTLATNHPVAIVIQYVMLAIVGGLSLTMILRGVIVEAPASLLEGLLAMGQRLVPARSRA